MLLTNGGSKITTCASRATYGSLRAFGVALWYYKDCHVIKSRNVFHTEHSCNPSFTQYDRAFKFVMHNQSYGASKAIQSNYTACQLPSLFHIHRITTCSRRQYMISSRLRVQVMSSTSDALCNSAARLPQCRHR